MVKLYPLDTNQATLFNIFDSSLHSESLPTRPYCSDNLSQGIYPRLQRIAVTKRYIQLNPPQQQYWLVFDIDSEPTRVFRRQFILSHATLADSSNWR